MTVLRSVCIIGLCVLLTCLGCWKSRDGSNDSVDDSVDGSTPSSGGSAADGSGSGSAGSINNTAGTGGAGDQDSGAGGDTPSNNEPPLNGENGELGEIQCPLFSNGCQPGCTTIGGAEYDETRGCIVRVDVLDCSTESGFPDESVCRVETSTGKIYSIAVLALEKPGFLGWRECTDDEWDQVNFADFCGT